MIKFILLPPGTRLSLTKPEDYTGRMQEKYGGLVDKDRVHYWILTVGCIQCQKDVGQAFYKRQKGEPAELNMPRRAATEHDGHHLTFDWVEEMDPEHHWSARLIRAVEANQTPWRWLS